MKVGCVLTDYCDTSMIVHLSETDWQNVAQISWNDPTTIKSRVN